MKALLAALLLLAPTAALDAAEPSALVHARELIDALDAIAAAPTASDAYAYTRGLVGLTADPADVAPVDARAYLGALAPDADLRALDALPRDAYEALGALLGSHAAATQLLARGASMSELEAVRARLLLDAERVLALRESYLVGGAPVDACGALYLYLGDAPQTLACDHTITIAGFGDDVYLNRAGGAGVSEAALALDLGGDDARAVNLSAPGGAYGGAYSGFGALLDLAGDDSYHATAYWSGPSPGFTTAGVNGGAAQTLPGAPGVGLLLDVEGDDTYYGRIGTGGVNGGSSRGGSGALLDLGGTDVFLGEASGLTTGINGGSNDGVATFFDCGGGANLYAGSSGERGGVNGGGEQSVSSFVSCGGDGSVFSGSANGGGVNAGASGESVTAFVLLEGDATLTGSARYGGVNGGGYRAQSLLVAGRGSQHYEGTLIGGYGGVNGGAVVGIAQLIDLEGDDTYVARSPGAVGANGGGVWGGAGVLIDAAGDDVYDAAIGGAPQPDTALGPVTPEGAAMNGAGHLGCGFLLDLAGRDAYRADGGVWSIDESIVDAAACSARIDTPYV